MLPFLKRKEQAVSSPIIKHRTPDDKSDLTNHDEDHKDSDSEAIEACAKYFLYGIETRDVKAIAQAMVDAFDILEQRPHDEVDHEPEMNEEPNSLEAMNKSAASKRTIG